MSTTSALTFAYGKLAHTFSTCVFLGTHYVIWEITVHTTYVGILNVHNTLMNTHHTMCDILEAWKSAFISEGSHDLKSNEHNVTCSRLHLSHIHGGSEVPKERRVQCCCTTAHLLDSIIQAYKLFSSASNRTSEASNWRFYLQYSSYMKHSDSGTSTT